LRTASGQWLLVRGSVLGDGPNGPVAVIVEAAHRHQPAPLIADAYGLTEREQVVTQLSAQGLPTNEIARRLYLSPYTVQDHLKAIFEKVGVRSRGELVARLFFDHYAPRMTVGSGPKPVAKLGLTPRSGGPQSRLRDALGPDRASRRRDVPAPDGRNRRTP
jgi:DNA-binding CsgD family transcriptional regulator